MKLNSLLLLLLLLLIGCGSDNDTQTIPVDESLSLSTLENELQLDGFSTTGSVLLYESGAQDTSYNFNRIYISKVNSTTEGDTLAYAYSLSHPQLVDKSRFVAFYIDIDNDPSTGESIEGIGADRLLLDSTIFESSTLNSEYFIWSETLPHWEGQSISGLSASIISEEISSTYSIKVPYFQNINDLFGLTDAKGVFTIRTFASGDPNDNNSVTLAVTPVFSINTPL